MEMLTTLEAIEQASIAGKKYTKEYVDDQLSGKVDKTVQLSDIKLFATEDIEALQFKTGYDEEGYTVNVLNGYKCFTVDGNRGSAEIGIFNGVLRGRFSHSGLDTSLYTRLHVGSINAKAGKSYAFPKTLCNSFADNGYAYLEILDEDNNCVVSSPKVVTKEGTYDEADPSYKYDEFYYDSFVFTPTSDGIYKIALRAYSYGYYGNNIDRSTINLYDFTDLSLYVDSQINEIKELISELTDRIEALESK